MLYDTNLGGGVVCWVFLLLLYSIVMRIESRKNRSQAIRTWNFSVSFMPFQNATTRERKTPDKIENANR